MGEKRCSRMGAKEKKINKIKRPSPDHRSTDRPAPAAATQHGCRGRPAARSAAWMRRDGWPSAAKAAVKTAEPTTRRQTQTTGESKTSDMTRGQTKSHLEAGIAGKRGQRLTTHGGCWVNARWAVAGTPHVRKQMRIE